MQLPSTGNDWLFYGDNLLLAGRLSLHGVMVFAQLENSVKKENIKGRLARRQKLMPPPWLRQLHIPPNVSIHAITYEKLLRVLKMESQPKNSNILYHYTSVNTLLKILDVKEDEMITLRATHAKFFNDPDEYNLAISLLKTAMKQYERENQIESRKSTDFDTKSIKSIGIVAGDPFILSLSENPDDLTMWRTYGSDGKGVAIGFDKSMLLDYCNGKDTTNTSLRKCAYRRKDILSNLTMYWRDWYDNIEFKNKSISLSSFDFFFQISALCFSVKRSEYSNEKEWRLCKNEHDTKNIKFLEKGGLIVPFIEHHLPRSIIKKIVIGPCVNKSMTKESISIFLRTRKYNFDKKSLVMSRVPYRHF